MAKIFPFRAYRYAGKAGDLNKLLTQPYDKISPAMQQRYLAASPYNLVRVILGEKFDGDTDRNNVYTRAAGYFNEWIAQGILEQDPEPGLFAYFQEFSVPDSGERLTRKGFIGLGAVEDYAAKIVHRHEQTLSGPKKDRREVLEHTRAHFGQIFMLYPDPEGEIDRILDAAARGPATASVTDEYGAVHTIYKISGAATILQIQRLMSDKKLLIADGHHRYETALSFRDDHPELADARNVMMTFVNMHSPGLRVLATHRVVNGLPDLNAASLLAKLHAGFRVRELKSAEELRSVWAEPAPDLIRMAAAFASGIYLIERERAGQLDVPVLHHEILEQGMGISADAVREEKYIRYVRGADAALDLVRSGDAQVAFLLEPTTVQQVADVSFSGGVMPQKSTDFYPKLLSGMTIYRLEQ